MLRLWYAVCKHSAWMMLQRGTPPIVDGLQRSRWRSWMCRVVPASQALLSNVRLHTFAAYACMALAACAGADHPSSTIAPPAAGSKAIETHAAMDANGGSASDAGHDIRETLASPDAANVEVRTDGAADAQAQDAAMSCPASPEPLPRDCSQDSDCVTVKLNACCGPSTIIGVRPEAQPIHARNERCFGQCGPLGCAGGGVIAEDGLSGAQAGIVVGCDKGTCRTRSNEPRFTCNNMLCGTTSSYCYSIAGGLPTSGVSYSCRPFPSGCSDCACLGFASAACLCMRDADAGLHVSCFAP